MYACFKSKWNTSTSEDNSDVCANRFYTNIEEQKNTISEYLEKNLEDDKMTFMIALYNESLIESGWI